MSWDAVDRLFSEMSSEAFEAFLPLPRSNDSQCSTRLRTASDVTRSVGVRFAWSVHETSKRNVASNSSSGTRSTCMLTSRPVVIFSAVLDAHSGTFWSHTYYVYSTPNSSSCLRRLLSSIANVHRTTHLKTQLRHIQNIFTVSRNSNRLRASQCYR